MQRARLFISSDFLTSPEDSFLSNIKILSVSKSFWEHFARAEWPESVTAGYITNRSELVLTCTFNNLLLSP